MGLRITQQEYDAVDNMLKKKNHEIEAKINKNTLTFVEFQRALTYFAKQFTNKKVHDESLDIITKDTKGDGNIRVSLLKMDDIVEYCKSNKIPFVANNPNFVYIRKTADGKPLDLAEYPLRVKCSLEEPISPQEAKAVLDGHVNKTFRLKKRISMYDNTGLFRFDFTIVRSSMNKYSNPKNIVAFQNASILTYEVEIEFDQLEDTAASSPPSEVKVVKAFFSHMATLLKVIDDVEYLLPFSEKEKVLLEYITNCMKPASIDKSMIQRSPKTYFAGPQPVTLEKHNIVDDPLNNTLSILSGDYTLTEKADGERQLLYIDSRGLGFLINSRLSIMNAGIKTNPGYAVSLFDAEVIKIHEKNRRLVLLFDCYVLNSNSVINLPLIVLGQAKDKDKKSRIVLCQEVCKNIIQTNASNIYDVKPKKFVFPEKDKFFAAVQHMLASIGGLGQEYHRDGIIFTPASFPVGANSLKEPAKLGNTWQSVMKWKPPNENTVDFLVETEKDSQRNDVINMNFAAQNIKTLNLFVGSKAKFVSPMEYVNRSIKNSNSYFKKLFDVTDKKGKSCSSMDIILDIHGRMMCNNQSEEIQNDSIVEMWYDMKANAWRAMRVRQDKTELYRSTRSISNTANDYKTALSIWKTIQDPILDAHLTGVDKIDMKEVDTNLQKQYFVRNTTNREESVTYSMKTFHNYYIKSKTLIGFAFASGFASKMQKQPNNQPKSLLDLACGEGGDLDKWLKNGYTDVLGLDLSSHNITNPDSGAYSRLIENKEFNYDKHRYIFLPMDVSELINEKYMNGITDDNIKKIAKNIWGYSEKPDPNSPMARFYKMAAGSSFDVVSCQFAIHYFFKNDETLSNFCKNVGAQTKMGGYFIGTCFDANEVNNALSRNDNTDLLQGEVDGKVIWRIRKKYDNVKFNPDVTGQKIGVFVETINSHNKDYDEYLVGFNRLVAEMKKVGLRLLNTDELIKIGKSKSTAMFSDSFAEMSKVVQKSYAEVRAMKMSEQEKMFSFMNRWFIFIRSDDVNQKLVKEQTPVEEESDDDGDLDLDPVDQEADQEELAVDDPSDQADQILGLIPYKSNSCYIDTFLTSIMHTPNSIFDDIMKAKFVSSRRLNLNKMATQVREELKGLSEFVIDPTVKFNAQDSVIKLRGLFAEFDAYYRKNVEKTMVVLPWKTDTLEPRDVIDILVRMFDIPNSITSSKNKQELLFNGVIIPITQESEAIIKVKDHFPVDVEEDITYKTDKAIMINISRGFVQKGKEIKLFNVLSFEEAIGKLQLKSIIVHHGDSPRGGHYTAYINHDGTWYHYNDMEGYEFIGMIKNMKKDDAKNIVALFYF